MFLNPHELRTNLKSNVDDYIETWMEAFLVDRKANGVAKGTLMFYSQKLQGFAIICEAQELKQISQITPNFLRQYFLHLVETNHNPGGMHAFYRVIRAFLLWCENEVEPDNWTNPIRRVKAPKVPIEPIEPVSLNTVIQMSKTCQRNTFSGERDRAILFFLLDTGVRASELLSINIEDVNQAKGEILIRQGKGCKPRYVFIGRQTKRALRHYLNHRKDDPPALWVVVPRFGTERLQYEGLRQMLIRRGAEAKVDIPAPHDFRRAFALSMLRNGTDVFTLAKLMGHEGITVLQRYLKQNNQDIELAHLRASPVDKHIK